MNILCKNDIDANFSTCCQRGPVLSCILVTVGIYRKSPGLSVEKMQGHNILVHNNSSLRIFIRTLILFELNSDIPILANCSPLGPSANYTLRDRVAKSKMYLTGPCGRPSVRASVIKFQSHFLGDY